jgi:hypothetical protein
MKFITIQPTYKKYSDSSSGQILIEVMIAVSISVVSLIGFFGLLKSSFQLTRITADNYIATHLAVEGVEIVANIMQTNYIDTIRNRSNQFNRNLSAGSWEIDFNTQKIDSATSRIQNRPFNFDGIYYGYGAGTSTTEFYRIVDIGFEPAGIPTRVSVTSTVYVDSEDNIPAAQVHDVFYYWWR